MLQVYIYLLFYLSLCIFIEESYYLCRGIEESGYIWFKVKIDYALPRILGGSAIHFGQNQCISYIGRSK